jgi:hypothetical protein
MNGSFSERAKKFFFEFQAPSKPGNGVEIINPYGKEDVRKITAKFFEKFYNDNEKRIFVFGINPGRFGGGVTGISFTDPIALKKYCGIENSLGERRELSSKFVYSVINEFGGASKFFAKFFLGAVFPLAIVKDGKNYNYYDSKILFETLKSYLLYSLEKQFELGAEKSVIISLGKKNADYIVKLNEKAKLFDKIVYLEHPRYIMQYKSKQADFYIEKYLRTLKNALVG